jgi:uncharacterized RDD family membrane protein YckC
MILSYQRLLKLTQKIYLYICFALITVTLISIIFTHLFHHSLSTGEYLKSIFIIWIICMPLFALFYFIIPKLKNLKLYAQK